MVSGILYLHDCVKFLTRLSVVPDLDVDTMQQHLHLPLLVMCTVLEFLQVRALDVELINNVDKEAAQAACNSLRL